MRHKWKSMPVLQNGGPYIPVEKWRKAIINRWYRSLHLSRHENHTSDRSLDHSMEPNDGYWQAKSMRERFLNAYSCEPYLGHDSHVKLWVLTKSQNRRLKASFVDSEPDDDCCRHPTNLISATEWQHNAVLQRWALHLDTTECCVLTAAEMRIPTVPIQERWNHSCSWNLEIRTGNRFKTYRLL